MKAIDFPEVNSVFAKDVAVVGPIPAYMDKSPRGKKPIVACYYLNWKERLMVLFFGRIWITVVTGNGTLAPMWLSVVKKMMITNRKQRRNVEKIKKKLSIPPPGENVKVLRKV